MRGEEMRDVVQKTDKVKKKSDDVSHEICKICLVTRGKF